MDNKAILCESIEDHGVNGVNAVNVPLSSADTKLITVASLDDSFKRLWEGQITDYESQPEAELALCRKLAHWTGNDPIRMDHLFRRSKLMSYMWDKQCGRETYGSQTIQKAMEGISGIGDTCQKEEFRPIQPLRQRDNDLPPFPVSALPQVLREYVEAVAAHSQTSADMAAVIGIGVLAVCLQGKFMVQGTPGYKEPLSLYTVVIAAPGERKSSVMREMTRYLYDYEKEYNEKRAPEIRKNRIRHDNLERRIDSLQDKLKKTENEDMESELISLQEELDDLPDLKPARFFVDDCSSEALVSLLANNNGVFSVISTEGGIFDIMAGRYSNKANLDVWLKGHCGDAIRVDRLGREPEYIPHPTLSAILTIQPRVLDEIMSNTTMTGRGLIARFLYALPPSRIGNRVFCAPAIPDDIRDAYRDMIYCLMEIQRSDEEVTLTLSNSATSEISNYFVQHEAFLVSEGQMISDWGAKYIGAILRIAGLLHVAEYGETTEEISEGIMKRAIEIGKYFLAHSSCAYSMMGSDLAIKKAGFILERIKREKITKIKRWELAKICRSKYFKNSEDIQSTLELLEKNGYLRLEKAEDVQRPGRKPDIWVLINPDFYADTRTVS